ncbi:MAG TPA: hypothetical protein VM118_11255, partial [Acidobacteriota bacterium]|nr:hypothetical protein [Acidobacteriota bacterium]
MPGGDTLAGIYRADREKLLTRRRYSFGSVVGFAGGQAEIDVGAVLPDGSTVYLSRPAAEGFTPAVGQQVAIVYPNSSPHSGYVAAPGSAAAVAPGGTVIPDGSVTAAKIADGACLAEILDDDGAGSLLDADKLDGQEGSYYAPVDNPTFTGAVNLADDATGDITA